MSEGAEEEEKGDEDAMHFISARRKHGFTVLSAIREGARFAFREGL